MDEEVKIALKLWIVDVLLAIAGAGLAKSLGAPWWGAFSVYFVSFLIVRMDSRMRLGGK